LLADWALKYHAVGKPGKLSVVPSKAVGTAADLSVAYSPGVAEPCLEIRKNIDRAYDYTARGHLVGVLTNGTAVLGLGNIGALAGKPVMEGKAVLFKRFADLDAFDLEIDEPEPARFVDVVCAVAPTFGGINLEDIRAPECFFIEEECGRRLDIPVFHDDQHGTAIIAGAGLLNALELVGKRIDEVRVVFSGAGAAGFACTKYFLRLGISRANLVLSDVQGVVYRGRGDGNYLEDVAADTTARTLAQALEGADVFVGLSAGNLLTPDMLRLMRRDPIVFALANPIPEIDYPLAVRTRPDVIMATGRSDYPNQINNVTAFPYVFRGALDARARAINDEMKMAATRVIAALAREPVTPEAGPEVPNLEFGREYLIPKPFDRRLLSRVAAAVAEAAVETGVARVRLDLPGYQRALRQLAQVLPA
jgi:malate dehydrogenase (oxaloacetate-decarboxylating)(NADP+)